jgi:glyoxylase-like metal-dependent hydrolase (beta-lactamase superfamily II)
VLFTGAHVYVYAARAGDKILLFDTGPDPQGRGLDGLLATLYAGRANVQDIFLTHAHGDHLAGVPLFPHARAHLGAPDVDLAGKEVRPDRLIPAVIGLLAPAPRVEISDPLNGEVEVDVGGNKKVRAIPTPGHTFGSYSYLYDGVLFVGDTLALDHGKLGPGPGVFTSDAVLQAESIAKLKQISVDMVCTGHGGCTRAGEGTEALSRAMTSR